MAVRTPTRWALLSVCLLLAAPAGRAQSGACMKEAMKVSSDLENRGCFVDPFPTADPYHVVDGSSDTYAHVLDINATSLCFGWNYNLPDLWRYKMMPSIRLHVSSAGTISSRGTDDLFVVSVLRKAVEGVQQQIGPRISVFDDVSSCGGAVPGQNNCPSYKGPLPDAGCEELKLKLDWRVFQPHCEDAEVGDAFQVGLVARVSTPGTAIYVLGAEVFYEQGAAVADEEEGAELSCAATDPNKPQAVAVASDDNDGTVAADRVDSFGQLTPEQQQQVLSQAGGSGFIPGPVVVVLVVNVNNTVIANGDGSVACLVQGNNNAQACVGGVGDGDRTAVANAAPTASPGTDSVNVDCFPFCDGNNPLSDVQAECFPFCPEG